MDIESIALRIASSPLSERPDYGTAGRFQERIEPKDKEKLKSWKNTEFGQDLLHVIQSLTSEMKKKEPKAVPYLLENLANLATEALLYIKS